MGLIISRKLEESYYLLANRQINPGEYIKIKKIEYSGSGTRDFIDAPESVVILREEVVDERGGLEEVIRQIKEGIFKFKDRKNG